MYKQEVLTMNILSGILQNPIFVFVDIGVDSGLIETGAVIASTHDSDYVSSTVDELVQRTSGIALARI